MTISATVLLLFLAVQATRCQHVNGDIVDTDPTADLQLGTRGELACRVERRVYTVVWYKVTEEQVRHAIIYLDAFFNVGEKGGPGYENGTHDITDNFTLVIKDVHVASEGRYICEITDFESDNIVNNVTDVSVFSSPQEPFPQIEECLKLSQYQFNNSCIINDSIPTLTCSVQGYYPDITLSFFNGLRYMNYTQTNISENLDRTIYKAITVNATPSEEPYTCVASDIPGKTGNRSAQVILSLPESSQHNALDINISRSTPDVDESSTQVHYNRVTEEISISSHVQMEEELEIRNVRIVGLEHDLDEMKRNLKENENTLKQILETNEKRNIDEKNEELEEEIKIKGTKELFIPTKEVRA